jgi:predicted transcriptional regulator
MADDHTDAPDSLPSTIEYAADIIAAYVSNNAVGTSELPSLIGDVHKALTRLASGQPALPSQRPEPAVNPKRSIQPDFIICLDDGKRFKSLRRHLSILGMTPDAYRQKWGLPSDYPMVAPNYSAKRSALAVASGLGRKPADVSKRSKRSNAKAKPNR